MELNFFSLIIDASVNLARTFLLRMKKNETKQNKNNAEYMDENFKVLLLRNSRELRFLCDCIIGVCSLNVLKNLFIMLLS